MVKNVAKPPRISRPKVDPRSEILKNRSTLLAAAGGAAGRSAAFFVSDMTGTPRCLNDLGADAGWIVPSLNPLRVFAVLRNRVPLLFGLPHDVRTPVPNQAVDHCYASRS